MMKKLFAFMIVISISFWALAPGVSAITAEELQAAIDDLLAELAILQDQLSDLTGEPTTTIVGCTITSFDRNLSQGMTGDDVKCLQIVLNTDTVTKLADSDAGSPGNETTYFGPITKAGVIKFQEKYADEVLASWGLTTGTGYVGSTSRAKLNTLLVVTPVPTECTTDADCATGYICEDEVCVEEEDEVTGEGFSAALAADTPESTTIVSDSTTDDGGQVFIPALKVKFSNGNDSDITVTGLKFKRGGISADTDLSQAYIFDGDTKLAEYNSFSSGVLTFSGDLFTVEAGKSKTITLKFDLTNQTESGKTIYFKIVSADDITSDAASVEGTFPLTGNIMTTARAADIGQLTIATSTDPSSTLDPDDDVEVFNFKLTGADQILHIKRIKFTNIGSTAYDDLQNFKLYDGGTQLLTTIENMETDKTVTFVFGDDPLVIDKGKVKAMHLRADIPGGTNRTFQFSIQEQTDTEVYDTEYGIYIKPNADGWVVQKATASTINTGKLTLTRASDTPSGNVAKDGTGITLVKFDIKATGEDVKISSLIIDIYGTVSTDGLYQTKIYYDGSQKGTTDANASTGASASGNGLSTFEFGNTFIVEKGTTKTLEVRSDIRKEGGTAFDGGETLTAAISSLTATGRTSLASVTTVSAAGHQLTVGAGTLSVTKNAAVPNWSATIPNGVPGQTEALVGAFLVTGGTGEGADITAIKVTDDGTYGFPNLANLKVYNGTKDTGTQIGDTQSSLTYGSTYSFYPSPYLSVSANEQILVYLYADIKTPTSTADGGYLKIAEVDGTGKETNSSVDYTSAVSGQTHYIAAAGSLSIASATDKPLSVNMRGGSADSYAFHKLKFVASAAENIEVTRIMLDTTLGGSAPTSTLNSISLWDSDDEQVGETYGALNELTGRADFNLIGDPWVISAGATEYLTIKAMIPIVETHTATSAGEVTIWVATSTATTSVDSTHQGIAYKGAISGTVATNTGIYSGNAMYTYRTTVSAEPNDDTPSDPGSGNGGQYEGILYFDVTNLGAYSAYLNGVTTTISHSKGTGLSTTSVERLFYIYKDGYPGGTIVASTSLEGSHVIDGATSTFSLADYSAAEEIAAGATKTFYLIGDLRDCTDGTATENGSSIDFQIADGTDFNWDDNLSTAIETTRTKIFPLLGETLSF